MGDVNDLVSRIKAEIAAHRQKTSQFQAEQVQEHKDRLQRLERLERVVRGVQEGFSRPGLTRPSRIGRPRSTPGHAR